MEKQKPKVIIFTDGACRGNPGIGGWGVLLRAQNQEKQLRGSEELTTNNRMELTAVIEGLAALKQACEVVLTTDSKYVQLGVSTWLSQWKQRQWRNAQKQTVKNQDLWQKLDQLLQQHQVTVHWVKGHANHVENELVDALANQAIEESLVQDKGTMKEER